VALRISHRGREYDVEVLADSRVRVDGAVVEVRRERDGTVRVDGVVAWAAAANGVRWVFLDGQVYEFSEYQPKGRARASAHEGALAAPMPATVRRILVAVGDRVTRGDPLVVLEAMKMELPVRATTSGTIRALLCREGELVQPGVTLLEIDPAP
jgi:biotin carboxyl carrier protein